MKEFGNEEIVRTSKQKSIFVIHFKDRVGRLGCDSPLAHYNNDSSLDIQGIKTQ